MLIRIVDGQGPGELSDGSGLKIHLHGSSTDQTTAVFFDSSDKEVFKVLLTKGEEIVKGGYRITFKGFRVGKEILAQPLSISTGKPLGGLVHPMIAELEIINETL